MKSALIMKSVLMMIIVLLLCGAAHAQEIQTVPAIYCLNGTVWSDVADQCIDIGSNMNFTNPIGHLGCNQINSDGTVSYDIKCAADLKKKPCTIEHPASGLSGLSISGCDFDKLHMKLEADENHFKITIEE